MVKWVTWVRGLRGSMRAWFARVNFLRGLRESNILLRGLKFFAWFQNFLRVSIVFFKWVNSYLLGEIILLY